MAEWEELSNEREVGERLCRPMEVGNERVAWQGPKRVILLVRKLGVQNARARQKS